MREPDKKRMAIMEKARAKRQRRAESQLARKGSGKREAAGVTEKVVDLARDAAAQVGGFMKTAAEKIQGRREPDS